MEDTNLPTSGLTDKELKLSYWYVTNKLFLRKLLIIALIGAGFLLWFYVIFGLIIFLVQFDKLQNDVQESLFSPAATSWSAESANPKPLDISQIQVFPGAEGLFDLSSQVSNGNKDWLAQFDFTFQSGASSTELRKGFVLPGSRKYLFDLGNRNNGGILEVSNLRWRRIYQYESLKSDHDRFLVENEEFIPPAKAGDPSRVKFDITNQSAYGYWEMGAVVGLYSGSSLISVNYASLPSFKSGEKRTVELNWTQELPSIEGITIEPDVNFLESKNIMPPTPQ